MQFLCEKLQRCESRRVRAAGLSLPPSPPRESAEVRGLGSSSVTYKLPGALFTVISGPVMVSRLGAKSVPNICMCVNVVTSVPT